MPLIFEYFPPEFILLQEEIAHHPELIEKLGRHPPNEFEIRMMQVARYCDIMLEGTYQPADWPPLALICVDKLKQKRGAPRDLIIVKELPT